ncbi:MAG TPA: glycosyltransferase family 2 protein [Verrucomicrobiae bacterium]
MSEAPILSVVAPCFNEQGNLIPLVIAIRDALEPLKIPYEIVIADDVSRDDSWKILQKLGADDQRIRAVRLNRNCGQSAAVWVGIQAATGHFIATLDADLQNHPRELPRFLEAIQRGDSDCVCGSRVAARAQGDSWVRRVSSKIANGIRNRITHETVSDSACGYRIFKRECAARLKFFKGMHRFMPTLFRIEGFVVTEIPISHHTRLTGQSNYGVMNRLFVTIYDLLAVRWMQKRMFRFEVKEQINFPPSQPE